MAQTLARRTAPMEYMIGGLSYKFGLSLVYTHSIRYNLENTLYALGLPAACVTIIAETSR